MFVKFASIYSWLKQHYAKKIVFITKQYYISTSYLLCTVMFIKHKLNGYINAKIHHQSCGGVAQMVERALSMREVPGSMPGTSTLKIFFLRFSFLS